MHNNSIKNLIKISKEFIKTKWFETKDAPKEKVQELKDLFFIPALNKLLFLSLETIEYDDSKNFKLCLMSFKEIYELSNQENLGYSGHITEWIQDNNKKNVKAKDHLSWTVPSKETLKRFYVLSAFITKSGKYSYLKELCDLEVEKESQGRYSCEKLLFYPGFDYNSGEGTLTSIFDEAREFIVNNPTILKKYFDNENEKAINFTCRGDFLIEYYYFMNDIQRGGRFRIRRLLNFLRFNYERVKPLIQKIILRPKEFEKLSPFNKEKFLEFLNYIADFSHRYLFEYVSDWDKGFMLAEVKKMLGMDVQGE